MSLNESHMPVPTNEARSLQLKQFAACDAMYDAYNQVRAETPGLPYAEVAKNPAVIEKTLEYELLVEQLEQLLGPDAHCCQVDCDLWSSFSDWYKSESGFRPRGMHFTRADVKKRLEAAR